MGRLLAKRKMDALQCLCLGSLAIASGMCGKSLAMNSSLLYGGWWQGSVKCIMVWCMPCVLGVDGSSMVWCCSLACHIPVTTGFCEELV